MAVAVSCPRCSRAAASNASAKPGGGALATTGKQGYGIRSREVAPLPEPSSFSKVNTEVPDLDDYHDEPYPQEYWAKWPEPVEHLDDPWLVADEIEAIWQETKCVPRKEVDKFEGWISYRDQMKRRRREREAEEEEWRGNGEED